MNAELEVTNNQAQTLPEEAIVRYENKQYVFVALDSNQFEMVEVKTGDSEKGYTAVSLPESLQDKAFVTKGAYWLLMKMKNKSEE
jgi:membrane fusion protein, heavy metal efflux system